MNDLGQSIRIWIRRNNELIEVIKILTKDNMYLMKFRLERELRNIHTRFFDLKKKGVIFNSIIYPKSKLRKNRRIIRELVYSRKSTYQNLKIVREFILKNLKNNSNI